MRVELSYGPLSLEWDPSALINRENYDWAFQSVLRGQGHRVIDHLPVERLPALADLIEKLVDEDDEPVTDAEIAEYKRIRQEMRNGDFVPFDEVFGEN